MFGFRILDWFGINSADTDSVSGTWAQDETCISNPASGLPMAGGCGGLDVAGNPYGVNLQDSWTHSTCWDSSPSDSNCWDSSMSSWDD